MEGEMSFGRWESWLRECDMKKQALGKGFVRDGRMAGDAKI
jgi:hypothetical protein